VRSDADVLAAIARLQELVDPVPEFVRDAARAAFRWRDPDTARAELVADDLLEEAGLRGPAGPRLLTFRGPDVELVVEVHTVGPRRRVLAQVRPAGPGTVQAVAGPHERTAHPDQLGRFVLDDLTPGPLRLRWAPAHGPAVVTAWTTI